jgi:hypothetical protein
MHFRSELISIEHFEIGVWLGLFSEIALLWRLKAEDRVLKLASRVLHRSLNLLCLASQCITL